MRITAGHASSTFAWQGNPGIESWQVSLGLSFDGATSTPLTEVVIATAALWRIRTEMCEEIGYELDNISADFGVIGAAIDEAPDNLEDWRL